MDSKNRPRAQNAALYKTLNRNALYLWRLFGKISQTPFLKEGRVPTSDELHKTPVPCTELEEALALSGKAQEKFASLPRELKPFFNIISLLLLYFRSLQACLAELMALDRSKLPDGDVQADKKFRNCQECLADCRNMAAELATQWVIREQLLEEAACMLGICRDDGAETVNPDPGEETGALGLFIASSRIRKFK